MNQPERLPLFSISDLHAAPTREFCYRYYFGEQSNFLFRQETKEVLVCCGDDDWTAYPVVNGQISGLLISPDEQAWLQDCLKAV